MIGGGKSGDLLYAGMAWACNGGLSGDFHYVECRGRRLGPGLGERAEELFEGPAEIEAPKKPENANSGPGRACAAPYPAKKVSCAIHPRPTVKASSNGSTTCPPPKTKEPAR